MTQNKLKLNDDKTEALLVKSNRTIFPDAQPASLRAGTADIPFLTCAHNLRLMISDNKHISTVCHSVTVKIRRICSIRQYLMVKVARTVCVFILSKLKCCNSLLSCALSDCPLYLLSRLQ